MAIAHTATVSRTGNVTTPMVLDRVSIGTSNRILIGIFAIASETVTLTPPAGFTLINSTAFTGGSLWTYWHEVNSDPASWNFTTDLGANTRYSSIATEFSGVNVTTPIDTATEQANASSTSVTAPGLDPAFIEDMLVFAGAVANTSTWTPPSSPGSFTEPTNGDKPAAANISGGTSYLLLSSGAATGDVVATASSAGINAGQLIALRDASATPDVTGDGTVSVGTASASGTTVTGTFTMNTWT